MRIGFNGDIYSDAEYFRILKVADIIVKVLLLGRPLRVTNFLRIKEYAALSVNARKECLHVLCEKRGVKKLKFTNKTNSNTLSFYAASVNDANKVKCNYEFVCEVKVQSLFDDVLRVLKEKKEMNMTELASRAHRFKQVSLNNRTAILEKLTNDGLIKVRKLKNGITGTILISLVENTAMTDKSRAKTKSEELIEQANKLLAAAEEAKKEEEKQLAKHEVMSIQREINVEIIEMEKQIDGIIDSFSKIKNLFDKLKK